MSVYCDYIVKSDSAEELEAHLNALLNQYPICEVTVKETFDVDDNRSTLKKLIDRAVGKPYPKVRTENKNYLYRRLGVNESVLLTNTAVVTVDKHHCGRKPATTTQNGWYAISTTIDYVDDGKMYIEFAENLKATCSRVCWKPDTNGDQYSDDYYEI